MPHWIVWHPPGTFEDETSKRALSESITAHYTRPGSTFPPFYVVVTFQKVPDSEQWIGGRKAVEHSSKPFIRLQASHIHIRLPNSAEIYKKQMEQLNARLKPHILDKGYSFELHVVETERLLWTIDGLAPPEFGSEDEKVWHAENRAVRGEEMEAMRRKHKL